MRPRLRSARGTRGRRRKPVGDPAVKPGPLGLDAVGLATARCRLLGPQHEQHGAVGQKPLGGDPVYLEHLVHPEPPGAALVGQRRVDEAVGDDGRAPLERRPDHLLDQLRARRRVEQRLGPVADAEPGIEQDRADALAGCGAAGLAHRHDLAAGGGGGLGQEPGLRGLATSVKALEGDEHHPILPTAPRVRPRRRVAFCRHGRRRLDRSARPGSGGARTGGAAPAASARARPHARPGPARRRAAADARGPHRLRVRRACCCRS